jgi:hypothetical protein
MYLNKPYSKVLIGKTMTDAYPIQSGLKQGDGLSPLLFNFTLKYSIRKIPEKEEGLVLNETHQFLVYADNVNILDENTNTAQKNTEALSETRSNVGLEESTDKIKYIVVFRHQNAGRNHNLLIANDWLENMTKFKYLRTTVTIENCIDEGIRNRLNSVNACYNSVRNRLSTHLYKI